MLIRVSLAAALVTALSLSLAAAQTQSEESAQSLANCAGAISAAAGVNVLTYAGNGDAALDAILARMNTEPGVEGMTGRYAASAARSFWAERPAAEREAEAAACRARFTASQ